MISNFATIICMTVGAIFIAIVVELGVVLLDVDVVRGVFVVLVVVAVVVVVEVAAVVLVVVVVVVLSRPPAPPLW